MLHILIIVTHFPWDATNGGGRAWDSQNESHGEHVPNIYQTNFIFPFLCFFVEVRSVSAGAMVAEVHLLLWLDILLFGRCRNNLERVDEAPKDWWCCVLDDNVWSRPVLPPDRSDRVKFFENFFFENMICEETDENRESSNNWRYFSVGCTFDCSASLVAFTGCSSLRMKF